LRGSHCGAPLNDGSLRGCLAGMPMPARRCERRPRPLPSRCARAAFLSSSTHIKDENRSDAVSEGPERRGPTSPRSRCPVPGPPAPADRPVLAKVIVFGRSGRERKKRGEKRSRLAPVDKVYVKKLAFYIYIYMTRRRPVADTARGVDCYFSTSALPLQAPAIL
jgi:hypothetical protein